MRPLVLLTLAALAVNAVLVQTLLPEDSAAKNLVRIAAFAVACSLLFRYRAKIPVTVFFLLTLSGLLFLARENPDQLSFIFVLVYCHMLMLMEERKLEKYLVLCSCIALVLPLLFIAQGLTQNSVLDYRERVTFGVASVNFFYNLVYSSGALVLVYWRKHLSAGQAVVAMVVLGLGTYFFIATDARAGFASLVALVLLLPVVPFLRNSPVMKFAIAILPGICLTVSILIATLGASVQANETLSFRPLLWGQFLATLDPVDILFSSSVKYYDGINTVDNSYIHLLVGGGVALTAAFMAFFYRAVMNLFASEKYVEIAFLIATCLYFSMESLLVRSENMFVIYFWYLVVRHARLLERPVVLAVPRAASIPRSIRA